MNLPFDDASDVTMLLAGIMFGYFLEVGGLGSPRKLTAQFSLRDWTVFKVMFTAIVVAAGGLWLFELAGWLRPGAIPVQTLYFPAVAWGGALVGGALAIGGYCPGTAVVGLFSGRVDALIFMVGMLAGTQLFAVFYEPLQELYLKSPTPEGQTIDVLLGLPVWMVLAALIFLASAGFRIGKRVESARGGAISANELAGVAEGEASRASSD